MVAKRTAWMRRRGKERGVDRAIKGGAQSDYAERIAEIPLGPRICGGRGVFCWALAHRAGKKHRTASSVTGARTPHGSGREDGRWARVWLSCRARLSVPSPGAGLCGSVGQMGRNEVVWLRWSFPFLFSFLFFSPFLFKFKILNSLSNSNFMINLFSHYRLI
jgi:hypothetical protein